MMNNHSRSRLRTAGGMIALATALWATAGLGAASAQEREGRAGERERFVIMEMREGGALPRGLARSFRVQRDENGEIVAPEGCNSGSEAGDRSAGDRRPAIILCGRGGEMSAERRLEALERARSRIAEATGERGTRHRSEVLDVLDREIARMRSR